MNEEKIMAMANTLIKQIENFTSEIKRNPVVEFHKKYPLGIVEDNYYKYSNGKEIVSRYLMTYGKIHEYKLVGGVGDSSLCILTKDESGQMDLFYIPLLGEKSSCLINGVLDQEKLPWIKVGSYNWISYPN